MVHRIATVAFEGIEAHAVDVQVQVAPLRERGQDVRRNAVVVDRGNSRFLQDRSRQA